MADNKLELVVEVDTNRANASIKSVNSGLSSMEATAAKSARGATQGIDGMTAAMVKGATAGNLFADAIKSAVTWAKEFTVGSVMMAAENAKAEASLKALATAHGVGAAAATKQVAAIEEIGFEFTEAAHAVQRLIIADMDLAKAEGLAKLAKNAAAVQNVSAGEAMEAIVLAIESGASRGLRTLGLFVDFQKEAQIAQLQLGRSLTETEEKQLRYNAVMREGAKIQGAHAAASQTVEGQLGALRREFNNLREDIGAKFQDDLKGLVGNLRGLVGWLKENNVDHPGVQDVKRVIRESEAIAAIETLGIGREHAHFLNLPFYQTGKVKKDPIDEDDVRIVHDILKRLKPDHIFVAGDMTDPHGTHRMCKHAIDEALRKIKADNRPRVWLYRGAWQEWDIHQVDVFVPLSKAEAKRKTLSIFKHESQKDRAVFPGPYDDREFWQRAEDRNKRTAQALDRLGLQEYFAAEAFVFGENT